MKSSEIDNILDKSKKLTAEFDDCLIGYNGRQFIYSSSAIIKKLSIDSEDQIEKGELKPFDQTSIKDSALIYALEDFYHNYESIKGAFDPIYIDDFDSMI